MLLCSRSFLFFFFFYLSVHVGWTSEQCRGLVFQDAMLVLKMTFKNMFFHAMKENIAMMAYNIVENEEGNSINASFHYSAVQQLFRTDRVYSYLRVDCKIANFY